jgi:hypothetical protein
MGVNPNGLRTPATTGADDGEIVIRVRPRALATGAVVVEVDVRETGVSMPAAARARLGTAIGPKIAEALNCEVDSGPRRDSTVSFAARIECEEARKARYREPPSLGDAIDRWVLAVRRAAAIATPAE